MNVRFANYEHATGNILFIGEVPESMVELQGGNVLIVGHDVGVQTHYVVEEVICVFTPDELAAKSTLAPGFIWKMPERIAIDTRSQDQIAVDVDAAMAASRRAGYPPLANLADALYWQAQGDDSKMTAYMAAVAAVKEAFPKPR